MAKRKPSYILRPGMTTVQLVCGFCYLPFYLVLLSWGLRWLNGLLGSPLTAFGLNALYFTINFLFIAAVYHRFFWYSLKDTGLWSFLQTLILAFVFYYAIIWAMDWVLARCAPGFRNPNTLNLVSLATGHYWLMVFFSVVLAPIVEETLVRGVVFGAFHRKNRIVAYLASLFLFSFMHTWGYIGQASWQTLVIAALQYVPASVALGWAYEKSGSILTPVALHMLINAISFGLIPTR